MVRVQTCRRPASAGNRPLKMSLQVGGCSDFLFEGGLGFVLQTAQVPEPVPEESFEGHRVQHRQYLELFARTCQGPQPQCPQGHEVRTSGAHRNCDCCNDMMLTKGLSCETCNMDLCHKCIERISSATSDLVNPDICAEALAFRSRAASMSPGDAEMGLGEAIQCLQATLSDRTSSANSAVKLHELGMLFKQKGDLQAAKQHLTEALNMHKCIHGDSANEEVAVTLRELGVVCKEEDDLQAAEQHLTEALNMHKCIHGDSADEEAAVTLQELGMVSWHRDDLQAAELHLTEALSMQKTHSWR